MPATGSEEKVVFQSVASFFSHLARQLV